MTRSDAIGELEQLAAALRTPLTEAELANGWTPASQEATLDVIARAVHALRSGHRWSETSIGRGLDHWGVEGGPLMVRACRTFNHLGEIAD